MKYDSVSELGLSSKIIEFWQNIENYTVDLIKAHSFYIDKNKNISYFNTENACCYSFPNLCKKIKHPSFLNILANGHRISSGQG